jgi:heme O synthase-like polyprenyltransferase
MIAERLASLELSTIQRPPVRSKLLADYSALTKPDTLIFITTFAGFCLAPPNPSDSFPVNLLLNML